MDCYSLQAVTIPHSTAVTMVSEGLVQGPTVLA